jgi:hypothetical protein
MNEILQYLKKHGEKLDAEIAVVLGERKKRTLKGLAGCQPT